MFTIRNFGGVALLLMGSTWLWLTPEFAGRGVATSGLLWAVTRALCLLTIAGFCVATWALFTRHPWWEAAALGSAVVGAFALLTFSVAATRGEEPAGTVTWNVFVHVLMLTTMLVLLLVPPLEHWVDNHVMSR
jgi:Kef-type K+ transport system membrane component KefB